MILQKYYFNMSTVTEVEIRLSSKCYVTSKPACDQKIELSEQLPSGNPKTHSAVKRYDAVKLPVILL